MEKALSIVLEQIKEKRDQIATVVSTSAAKDYAEYQKPVSRIFSRVCRSTESGLMINATSGGFAPK